MQNDMVRLGDIIRVARKSKGMTQDALARAAETALRTVNDLENNRRFPSYEVLFKIVRSLDLSADLFFWPDRITHAPEIDQLIRALHACDDRDRLIFMELAKTYFRTLQSEKSAKKTDDY